MIVLDTNIVLDLFLFDDVQAAPLKAALEAGTWQWLATLPMRDELQRVLAYPRIAPRLAFYQRSAETVLAQFDRWARLREVAPKATLTCSDPDDQKFIDLAVTAQATLLSKDRAILCMAKRLVSKGVRAQSAIYLIA